MDEDHVAYWHVLSDPTPDPDVDYTPVPLRLRLVKAYDAGLGRTTDAMRIWFAPAGLAKNEYCRLLMANHPDGSYNVVTNWMMPSTNKNAVLKSMKQGEDKSCCDIGVEGKLPVYFKFDRTFFPQLPPDL